MKKILRAILAMSGVCIFTQGCTFFIALGTPVPASPTSTLTPFHTPAMQATPLSSPTIQPSATIPLVIINTATPTPIPSTVTVDIETTKKGDYLVISRSTDQLTYKLGPIASGTYAIGPNDNYIIYCTYDGKVYAARLGDEYLALIGDVKKFTAMQRNVPPDLKLVIFFNNGRYKVDIREGRFSQNEILLIPTRFTE